MKSKNIYSVLLITALTLTACGKSTSSTTAVDDTSASGAAASVAGGALSSSGSGGTVAFNSKKSNLNLFNSSEVISALIPSAFASNACPTYKTTSSGCVAASGNLWLTYSSCSFGSAVATWTGTQELSASGITAACGTFPTPASSGTLSRQMVTAASSTTPASATRTSAVGTLVTIDDASANVANFNNDTISTLMNSGYGTRVNFTGSLRSSVTIARHISSPDLFSHTISGTLNIAETAGSSSRILTGNLKVYHNLLKIIGTSTFNNVTHSDTCCLPVSGSIHTTFAAGSVSPTLAGAAIIASGATETLTFTGCGTGTLAATDGTTVSVALNNCL
jgi:hypothetical protein